MNENKKEFFLLLIMYGHFSFLPSLLHIGFLEPMNPMDEEKTFVYLFNNIFFSKAIDTKDNFKVLTLLIIKLLIFLILKYIKLFDDIQCFSIVEVCIY